MDRNAPKWNLPRPFAAAGASMIASTAFFMLTDVKAAFFLIPALLVICTVLCIVREYGFCKVLAVVTAASVCSALLFAYKELAVVQPSVVLDGQTVSVEGTLAEAPAPKTKTTAFLLSDCVIDGKETGLTVLLYTKFSEGAETGDTVSAENATVRFAADKNEFYYHTLSDGCWLDATCLSVRITPQSRSSPGDLIKHVRAGVNTQLTYGLDWENSPIASALLTGDRSALSYDFTRALRIAGASHLFAVSGLHLSLWASVLFYVMKKRRNALFPNLAVCVFILFYIAVTGFSPSVLRAGIMSVMLYAGRLLKKPSDPLNSLGLAACILLTNNIYLAGNVSFLLSFFAIFAIITLYPVFQARETKTLGETKRRLMRWQNTVLLSLCVLLYTAPVSGVFFGSISLLSPVSSLVCALPVTLVMLTSFLGVLFGWFPFVSEVFFTVCDFGCNMLRDTVGFLSRFSFCASSVDVKFLSVWYIVSAVLIGLVWYGTHKHKQKTAIALMCCVSLLICFQIGKNISARNDVTVYIPAVGNATVCCISSDNYAFNVLIGTGEDYDDAAAIRSYLQRNAAFTLDALVIPRVSNAENGNALMFAAFPTDNVYSAAGNNELPAEIGTRADCFTLEFKNGLTYENLLTPDYALGLLYNRELRIVFCYYPGADLTGADPALFYGDYLICRGEIPKGLPTGGFAHVLVLSDKTAGTLKLPQGVLSTADTGDITIKTSASKK